MKLTVVRYRTKPEMAEENARLIHTVFQELRAKSPDDVRYLSVRLSDDTFVPFQYRRDRRRGQSDSAVGRVPVIPIGSQRAVHRASATNRGDHRRQLPDGWRGVRA
jgi:hypothetical protein